MKVFPDFWSICPADTVCSAIIDCLNKTAPVVEHDTGFRMIRTTNVRHGRVDMEDNRFVEEAVFNKWSRRARLKRGDIILSREAPLGEVGLLRSDAKAFLGQRTMLYRADPQKLDQHYLYYQMIGPYVQAVIHGQGQGSTVAHLRVPDAETLPIPVAPLRTQRKIAAVLAAYDDLIEANRRRIALLERMAEEIYREWFVRLRFPGHATTQITKGLPAGWSLVRTQDPSHSRVAALRRKRFRAIGRTARSIGSHQPTLPPPKACSLRNPATNAQTKGSLKARPKCFPPIP